jgi:hypothetical protein
MGCIVVRGDEDDRWERLDGALCDGFRPDARRRFRVGRPNKAKPFSFCLFFL